LLSEGAFHVAQLLELASVVLLVDGEAKADSPLRERTAAAVKPENARQIAGIR
jgi:hypothetical protein